MLTEDNKIRILGLFFEGPNERLHLREVARRVGLSATGAMKINLYSLNSNGLVSELVDFFKIPECIVIFGSYAKGEDTNESDIDIAVMTSMKEYPQLDVYEGDLNRKISLHLINNIKNEEKDFINTLAIES